ncbi:MAG TPA: hypothetical protein PLK13_05060, partial [Xanthobacteraceae bacterium]|nr:hypothetical protein [Xanthobacteraceae bacterium]
RSGLSDCARAARLRKPTLHGLIDNETARTKVSEWKRGVVLCCRQDAANPSQLRRRASLGGTPMSA